ncbi:hypothetical protein K470DRAFT_95880 [Piedraia hortae CBS 480.64]|uniref:G-protein coupled receptors family 2 profile 2 domain-containing protein n=1 Tax=Piedraia hortae CBS 480.64 TaxID=1314780 RepID=A0A6A7BX25_9PEZI|nr:hypothetical protein K470DRAFT_95880 [Piedraia hortae CBS 480.64]
MSTAALANITECISPFLNVRSYPTTGGETASRFCKPLNANLTCCLPCPLTDWVFDDHIGSQIATADHLSIGGFVLNVLLLLTFWILPEEKTMRHYLSVSLAVSATIMSLAFLIPLGTNPNYCHDDITPNNMNTDTGCAFTGSLLLFGWMGCVVWIMLRSIWTMLRIVVDFQRPIAYKWVALTLGIGLPAFYLAICLPISGVAYRLGDVCIPSRTSAFATWFVWVIVFSTLSTLILIFTIVYCIWKFALSVVSRDRLDNEVTTSTSFIQIQQTKKKSLQRRHRLEWARIKEVLLMQWRTIILTFIIMNESVYFAIVFAQQTGAAEAALHGVRKKDIEFASCLMMNHGNKNACLAKATGMGLNQAQVVATLILASANNSVPDIFPAVPRVNAHGMEASHLQSAKPSRTKSQAESRQRRVCHAESWQRRKG